MDVRYLYLKLANAKSILMLSTTLLALLFIAGCGQNYGRIHWDQNITRAFQSNMAEPGYNYYQYNIGMRVFAIVGLDPELELQSKIWRELASDTEEFKVATSRIWYSDITIPEEPRGAIIRSPNGEDVGVYYSSIPSVAIKFKPDNRVMVMLDTTQITGGPDGRRTD